MQLCSVTQHHSLSFDYALGATRNLSNRISDAHDQIMIKFCSTIVCSITLIIRESIRTLDVRIDGSGQAESIQNVFDDFICSEVERMD